MKNSTDMQYIYEVQVCLFMVNRLFNTYLSQEKQFIIISIIIIINNNNNNNNNNDTVAPVVTKQKW